MLEADFQREYGLDLPECLWGENRLSVRKIYALAHNLSKRSALYTHHTKNWDWNEELLATLIEVIDVGNIHFLAAQGLKKHELPELIKIPRPGKNESRRQATVQETAQIFKAGLQVVPKQG